MSLSTDSVAAAVNDASTLNVGITEVSIGTGPSQKLGPEIGSARRSFGLFVLSKLIPADADTVKLADKSSFAVKLKDSTVNQFRVTHT